MLPPGQPTLLVGAMHAGEIDTVLDQSVKATADVDLWHLADNPAVAEFVRYWTKADKARFWPVMVCPLMTQKRHWLCTAAMVLMPVSAPIKVLV